MADRLGVRLLGEFRLDGVELEALRSRQARTLLKRLAARAGRHGPADSLVEAVWPDGRPAQPDRDLHVLVSRARAVVGADRVVRRDGGYALVADWWDVDELATPRPRGGPPGGGRRRASGARTAAEGRCHWCARPLLADEPDAEWAADARSAAEAAVRGGAPGGGDGRAGHRPGGRRRRVRHRGAAQRPYDEAALRTLMRAHAAAGRPASALAEFARVRELLAEELGVDPAPETRALHEELLPGARRACPSHRAAAAGGLVGRDEELRALDAELSARGRGAGGRW